MKEIIKESPYENTAFYKKQQRSYQIVTDLIMVTRYSIKGIWLLALFLLHVPR